MIPVSANIQIQGLGRAFIQTIDHNRMYLTVPTTKTTHFYDVREGLLGELWGAYGSQIPIVLAKRSEDQHHITFTNTAKLRSKADWRMYWYNRNGEWSQDLALSCFAPTVSKIAQLVINPKTSADDIQKVVLDYFKMKVVRHSSDGGLFFKVGETEWDLEHVCNEVQRIIDERNGITYHYSSEDVLSMYETHAHDVFD